MFIHAGLLRSLPILTLTIASHGNDFCTGEFRIRSQDLRDLISVSPGETNIQQNDVWSSAICDFNGGKPIICQIDTMTFHLQHDPDAFSGIDIVVDDED